MIEVVLGLIVLAAGSAAAMGFVQPYLAFPVTLSMSYLLAAMGAVLVLHGAFRIMLRREGTDHRTLRMRGLTVTMVCLLGFAGFAVPAAAPLLNAGKIAGFPLGYYAAAQAALILFVIILFGYAARAESIENELPQS